MVGFIQATGSGNGGLAAGMKIADYVQNKKKEEDKLKGLASGFLKVRSGDDSGWDEMANADPNVAMNMWKSQQALDQKNLEKQFNTTNEYKNAQYLMSIGYPQEKAIEIAYKQNQNPSQNLTPYEKTVQMEQAKNDIEIARGDEDFKKMSPSVIGALDRAKKSLNSGSGVGPIGGTLTKIGLNPLGRSAENYANIESANTQMNQLLRAKLKATGLTGSELNSAVEANAYRYTISPTDNEAVVMQKIKNFETDILGSGKQEKQDDPLGIL